MTRSAAVEVLPPEGEDEGAQPRKQKPLPVLQALNAGDLEHHVMLRFVKKIPEHIDITPEDCLNEQFMRTFLSASGDIVRPLSEIVLFDGRMRWSVKLTVVSCGPGWVQTHAEEADIRRYPQAEIPSIAVPASYQIDRDPFTGRWHVTYLPTGVKLAGADGDISFEEARQRAMRHVKVTGQ